MSSNSEARCVYCDEQTHTSHACPFLHRTARNSRESVAGKAARSEQSDRSVLSEATGAKSTMAASEGLTYNGTAYLCPDPNSSMPITGSNAGNGGGSMLPPNPHTYTSQWRPNGSSSAAGNGTAWQIRQSAAETLSGLKRFPVNNGAYIANYNGYDNQHTSQLHPAIRLPSQSSNDYNLPYSYPVLESVGGVMNGNNSLARSPGLNSYSQYGGSQKSDQQSSSPYKAPLSSAPLVTSSPYNSRGQQPSPSANFQLRLPVPAYAKSNNPIPSYVNGNTQSTSGNAAFLHTSDEELQQFVDSMGEDVADSSPLADYSQVYGLSGDMNYTMTGYGGNSGNAYSQSASGVSQMYDFQGAAGNPDSPFEYQQSLKGDNFDAQPAVPQVPIVTKRIQMDSIPPQPRMENYGVDIAEDILMLTNHAAAVQDWAISLHHHATMLNDIKNIPGEFTWAKDGTLSASLRMEDTPELQSAFKGATFTGTVASLNQIAARKFSSFGKHTPMKLSTFKKLGEQDSRRKKKVDSDTYNSVENARIYDDFSPYDAMAHLVTLRLEGSVNGGVAPMSVTPHVGIPMTFAETPNRGSRVGRGRGGSGRAKKSSAPPRKPSAKRKSASQDVGDGDETMGAADTPVKKPATPRKKKTPSSNFKEELASSPVLPNLASDSGFSGLPVNYGGPVDMGSDPDADGHSDEDMPLMKNRYLTEAEMRGEN